MCACLYVCVLTHAHLSARRACAYVCVWARELAKCVSTVCDSTGGEGQREVLSRNRASSVSYYTPRLGEKKRSRGGGGVGGGGNLGLLFFRGI